MLEIATIEDDWPPSESENFPDGWSPSESVNLPELETFFALALTPLGALDTPLEVATGGVFFAVLSCLPEESLREASYCF
jgi:hypothetical protein